MAATAGSVTPCSAYCAAASAGLTGVLALDSVIKGDGRQFLLDIIGTGFGKGAALTMKNVGGVSSRTASNIDSVTELGVSITIRVDDHGG